MHEQIRQRPVREDSRLFSGGSMLLVMLDHGYYAGLSALAILELYLDHELGGRTVRQPPFRQIPLDGKLNAD